jgi:prophage antirepressor-like protein
MRIKTESWNGHSIRFIEVRPGDWQAIGPDVTKALDYLRSNDAIKRHCRYTSKQRIPHPQNPDKMITVNVIPEKDIYRLAFRSEQADAIAFQDWICDMLQGLRQASGLEAFQVFRMLDKEHQKEAMRRLQANIRNPARIDFVSANTIANKAISTRYGFPKMLKKDQMTPEMLISREPVLDDTVTLMSARDGFGLDISVSNLIYGKYCHVNN